MLTLTAWVGGVWQPVRDDWQTATELVYILQSSTVSLTDFVHVPGNSPSVIIASAEEVSIKCLAQKTH